MSSSCWLRKAMRWSGYTQWYLSFSIRLSMEKPYTYLLGMLDISYYGIQSELPSILGNTSRNEARFDSQPQGKW